MPKPAKLDMKPIVLTICTIVGAVCASDESFASSQDNAQARNLKFAHRHHAVDTGRSAVQLDRAVTGGVIPRAIRGGNPLQMLNPFAPATYGTAEENVSFDPEVPGKGNGINFLNISF
jgi:hypothetical protein